MLSPTKAKRFLWVNVLLFGAMQRPRNLHGSSPKSQQGRAHTALNVFATAIVGASLSVACLPRDEDVGRGPRSKTKTDAVSKKDPKPSKEKEPEEKSSSKTSKKEPKEKPKPSATPDPRLGAPFVDNFDRQQLGEDWRVTAKAWRITDGQLCGKGARNHPVWLARRIPLNARVEFDAISHSPDGDIKAEFWGDGRSAASGISYKDATSYLTIFGGWKNRFHVLARLDEHAKDRLQVTIDPGSEDLRARPVVPNQAYHFKVERLNGNELRWFVDDIEMHTLEDDEPLSGPGHEHFGFNNWDVSVCFDNLTITPL